MQIATYQLIASAKSSDKYWHMSHFLTRTGWCGKLHLMIVVVSVPYTTRYLQISNYLQQHSALFPGDMLRPGPWFNIKITSYQYRKSHYGDKTILRPSYLHNGISYTGKMASLYWIRAQWLMPTSHSTWAPSQYPKRRLSVRSRKVSKRRDLYLELSDRSEIWQALRQQCCRCACQISQRYDKLKYQSRGFETSRDLTKRRLFG